MSNYLGIMTIYWGQNGQLDYLSYHIQMVFVIVKYYLGAINYQAAIITTQVLFNFFFFRGKKEKFGPLFICLFHPHRNVLIAVLPDNIYILLYFLNFENCGNNK